jgi:phytoene dehydrogenase-like protein
MDNLPTIVVGGGLAGLTAAATLARAGHRVTLVEGADHVGGRARSQQRAGFDLNQGPHALYRAGGGLDVLRRLGVSPRGRKPLASKAGVWVDGGIAGFGHHLRTAVHDRLAVARGLTGLGRQASAAWAGRPATEWIESVTDDDAGRLLLRSLLRTTTYVADPDLLDAGAATRQLRVAVHGVLYLHHGWSSLADALADVVRANGGMLVTGSPVAAVEHDGRVHGVRLADGRTLPAAAVVVAVNDPRRAAGLLSGEAAARLGARAADAVAVRMASLDVALRPLPSRRFPAVLGVDDAIFVSVPSSVASVAPSGGAVIHVARYLRPGEEHGDHRPGLEAVLDVHQPEWRDHVVHARYVPRALVTADHPRPATSGTRGRPGPDAAGVRGLALAGDWVGPAGLLADASILSGAAAAATVASAMLEPVSGSPALA